FLIMVPSFHKQVGPQIPGGLKDTYYLVPCVHAALGAIAELLGLYIVLVAATKLVPRKIRFRRFKPWMRTALALWWVVILIGVGAYYLWYIAPPKTPVAQSSQPAEKPTTPERVTVTITNFQFDPQQVTIPVGATVEWVDNTGRHTVAADDGSFQSPTMVAGGRFEHKFDKPGTFAYY